MRLRGERNPDHLGWSAAARHNDQRGFGMVEFMIAAFILSVALLAIASAAFASLRAMSDSQLRQQATAMATESLEVVRSYPWSAIALREGDAFTPASFDHEQGTRSSPGAGELTIITPTGAVTGAVHTRTEGTLSLITVVTQPPDSMASRRVTAVVTYDGPGGAYREVRFSTLVAEAERGLGQPEFDVTPQVQTIRGMRGSDVCAEHALVNRGVRDRYTVEMPPAVQPATITPPGSWPDPLDTYAYLFDVDDPTDTEEIGSTSSFSVPTDAAAYVESGERVGIAICYKLPGDYDVAPSQFEVGIVISSEFMEDRERPLSNIVEVERERELFLYPEVDDLGDVGDQAWDGATSFGMNSIPPDPVPLPDYDRDGIQGLSLEPAEPGADEEPYQAARWTYRFDSARTVTGGHITLWMAMDADQGVMPEVWYRVERLPADGSGPEQLTEVADAGLFLSTTWGEHTGLTFAGAEFAPGDELALTVGCRRPPEPPWDGDPLEEPGPQAVADCLLGYGTADRDASVTVVFP